MLFFSLYLFPIRNSLKILSDFTEAFLLEVHLFLLCCFPLCCLSLPPSLLPSLIFLRIMSVFILQSLQLKLPSICLFSVISFTIQNQIWNLQLFSSKYQNLTSKYKKLHEYTPRTGLAICVMIPKQHILTHSPPSNKY